MNHATLWRINPNGGLRKLNTYRSIADAREGALMRGDGNYRITNSAGGNIADFAVESGGLKFGATVGASHPAPWSLARDLASLVTGR